MQNVDQFGYSLMLKIVKITIENIGRKNYITKMIEKYWYMVYIKILFCVEKLSKLHF